MRRFSLRCCFVADAGLARTPPRPFAPTRPTPFPPPSKTVCDNCTAEESDCPFVERTYLDPSDPTPVQTCQDICESTATCNAINIGLDGKGNVDCVMRSCNDIPPATDPINPATCPGCTYSVYSFYNGVAITLDNTLQTWERVPINQTACPDPNQPPAPLTPRDSGYTIGVVRRAGGDRLLLLGGAQAENNVRLGARSPP